jgi:hypothetical protein
MDKKWFDIGYNDQCWGYPALDHVWGTKNFPLDKKDSYRKGQEQAYRDGKAAKPWFLNNNLNRG